MLAIRQDQMRLQQEQEKREALLRHRQPVIARALANVVVHLTRVRQDLEGTTYAPCGDFLIAQIKMLAREIDRF